MKKGQSQCSSNSRWAWGGFEVGMGDLRLRGVGRGVFDVVRVWSGNVASDGAAIGLRVWSVQDRPLLTMAASTAIYR